MEQVKDLLQARKSFLLQVKEEKEEALRKVPEGSLRVCSHGKRTQYYHRNDPKDFNGVYIRSKDIELAKELAQKDYDRRVLRAIEKEVDAIDKYFGDYPAVNIEHVYDSLHIERQKLIKPIRKSDQQFLQDWESVEYRGKEFDEKMPEFYTAKGERVRSKSEVIIADTLCREGIPYRYEYPLYLRGTGRIYPDFTTLNLRMRKEILWEHLGMMDDFEYAEKAIQKIGVYERNGIFPGEGLILTYETKKQPLNSKTIMLMVQHYLL
ncbi:MAG: hypothetical protein ACI4F1_02910 [Bariatricus sp.]